MRPHERRCGIHNAAVDDGGRDHAEDAKADAVASENALAVQHPGKPADNAHRKHLPRRPIKIGDRYNYIDMLLYNIYDNCYAVIELKINEIKKEHIGQVETYMNFIDKNLRTINQGPTIGIIVCKKKNGYLFKYVTNKKIYEREYELV